jgi:two-component system, LytTR family, response regulator
MKIRVLIVDDEHWARKRIATLLQSEADIEVVGECQDASEAIEAIARKKPELVFLDVQMAGASGFDVLEAIGSDHMPVVIFATAYDKYALRAFDVHALDYLLKPFDEERFQKALDRARKDLEKRGSSEENLRALLASLRAGQGYLHRLVVKSGGRVTFLKAADIDWVEASGNYITLHVGRDTHLLRGTVATLEVKLDREQFVRIHRSAIVNLDRIKELQPWARGEQILVLKDGTRLTVGRAFRDRLEKFLQNAAQ